ncbi:uncharacterized protein [Phyllobates terribilis]|uniref:uncharacterized protein n=1 Tax=Phyllobates terribilis TaxID=111132 RepID=UPI003CCB4798
MTELIKMKLILVWICLISKTFLFPVQSPDVDDTTACRAQNPKLIYQGRDSNRGINVYIFEFLPESKEAKDRVEDTTMKNDFPSNRNSPISTVNREIYEDTIIPTNKPASIYDKKQTPDKPASINDKKQTLDTNTGTRDNTHMPGSKFSTVDAGQNDIERYENTSLLSNTTHGLQKGTSHIREVQKTGGHSNPDNYYVTERSALLDVPSKRNSTKTTENEENDEDTTNLINKPTIIYDKNDFPDTETGTRDSSSTPDLMFDTITSTVSVAQNNNEMYEDRGLLANVTEGPQTGISHTKEVKIKGHSNGDDYFGTEGSTLLDTNMGNQGPNTDFLRNINNSRNNIGCFESDGQCKYPPKPKEDIFVTKPPTQKDLFFSKRSMDMPDRHTKEEKNIINQKVKSSIKTKRTNKRQGEKQTKIIFQYSSGKRQKSGGKQHNYRQSSSESRSDSSQEFD